MVNSIMQSFLNAVLNQYLILCYPHWTHGFRKENEFVLLEKWESIEALSAHDVTEHMIEADASSSAYRAKPATVIKLFNL